MSTEKPTVDLDAIREALLAALIAKPAEVSNLLRTTFRKVYERRAALSILLELERDGVVRRSMAGVYSLRLAPAKVPQGFVHEAAREAERDFIQVVDTLPPR